MLEGAIEPKQIAELAARLEFPAIALADRNGLYGAMPFSDACFAKGVQPIIGTLLCIARPADAIGGQKLDWLALLAKDEQGYANLCTLVSAAHLDRPAGDDPHISFAQLEGKSDGLIALTAGGEGALARLFADGQDDKAAAYAERLRTLFPERLYVELSRRGDASEEAAKVSYEKMRLAYTAIFDRMGLTYRLVAADSGAMGGSTSAEFQVLADSGEDAIVACNKCDYAANVEVASPGAYPAATSDIPLEPLTKVHTPGKGSIADVAAFLNISPKKMLKSLLYLAGNDVVMVVVRGDHEVNEISLARTLGVGEVFLASEADVKKATSANVGYAGPHGFAGKVIVDRAAATVRNGATGANETDHHLTGFNFERDAKGEVASVRLASTGDPCPKCDGKLKSYKGIEAGHIFILGTHYTDLMGAQFSDETQTKKAIVMGCYGIGVSRLVATAVEQHNDVNGMLWPMSLAPYQVHICTLGKDEPVLEAAKKLYDTLWASGVEVLWDDRDERPGVKFKDADLIGIPLRVTIGGKSLAGGHIELKARTETDPKKAELLPAENAAKVIEDRVRAALAG